MEQCTTPTNQAIQSQLLSGQSPLTFIGSVAQLQIEGKIRFSTKFDGPEKEKLHLFLKNPSNSGKQLPVTAYDQYFSVPLNDELFAECNFPIGANSYFGDIYMDTNGIFYADCADYDLCLVGEKILGILGFKMLDEVCGIGELNNKFHIERYPDTKHDDIFHQIKKLFEIVPKSTFKNCTLAMVFVLRETGDIMLRHIYDDPKSLKQIEDKIRELHKPVNVRHIVSSSVQPDSKVAESTSSQNKKIDPGVVVSPSSENKLMTKSLSLLAGVSANKIYNRIVFNVEENLVNVLISFLEKGVFGLTKLDATTVCVPFDFKAKYAIVDHDTHLGFVYMDCNQRLYVNCGCSYRDVSEAVMGSLGFNILDKICDLSYRDVSEAIMGSLGFNILNKICDLRCSHGNFYADRDSETKHGLIFDKIQKLFGENHTNRFSAIYATIFGSQSNDVLLRGFGDIKTVEKIHAKIMELSESLAVDNGTAPEEQKYKKDNVPDNDNDDKVNFSSDKKQDELPIKESSTTQMSEASNSSSNEKDQLSFGIIHDIVRHYFKKNKFLEVQFLLKHIKLEEKSKVIQHWAREAINALHPDCPRLQRHFGMLVNDNSDDNLLTFMRICCRDLSGIEKSDEAIFLNILLECIDRQQLEQFNFLLEHIKVETKPEFFKILVRNAIETEYYYDSVIARQFHWLIYHNNRETDLALLRDLASCRK